MINKLLRVVLAAMIALLPLQSDLFAAVTILTSVTVGSQGTLGAVSTLTVNVRNVTDDSINATGLGFNAAAGGRVTTSPQYLEVNFNDNTVGFQAVLISTDNRLATANPKYTGIAQGSGMVGVTNKDVTVPLVWTVFDAKVNPPIGAVPGTGYSFQVALNLGEFFMQDKEQGSFVDAGHPGGDPAKGASLCNDANKNGTCNAGEFTDRNANAAFDSVVWNAALPITRCPSTFEGIDWDGDCYDGAKPFDAGFASLVFGVSGQSASIADASGFDEGTSTRGALGRTTTDGQVFMYLATDYTGAEAQQYKTSTLILDLVTIS